MAVVAIDPGTLKVGLALVDDSGAVMERSIVPPQQVEATLERWKAAHAVERAVLGDGTASVGASGIQPLVERVFGKAAVVVIDEEGTTLEARELWRALHPPTGLWRLVPAGLRAPDGPIDDLAAVVLARRWLAARGDKT